MARIPEEREWDSAFASLRRSPDPAFVLTPVRDAAREIVEFVYARLNPAALKLYDLTEDVVGMGLLELFPSARDNGMFDANVRAVQIDDRVEIVVLWTDGDGFRGAFTQRAVPFEDGVLVTAHDVADHRDVTGELMALSDVRPDGGIRDALELSVLDLSSAQRMAGLASWVWTPATDRLVWSTAVFEMLGLDPAPTAPPLAERERLYEAESWQRLRGVVAEAISDGTPYAVDLEFIRADSSRGWMRSWGEAVRDADGDVVQLRGYAQDVTEQLGALRALERSEQMLRSTQRMAGLGSWEWNLVDDRLSWSGELYRLFAMDPSQPPPSGDEHAQLYTDDSMERLTAASSKTVETGAPFDLELEFVRVDSTRGWARAWGEAVRDQAGAIVALRGYVHDLTDEMAARRALGRSEQMLRSTQRMAGVGSWEWDIAHDQVTWSDELYALYGRDPAQPPPAYAEQAQLYASESWERLRASVATILETGVPFELELEFVRPDSTRGWVQSRGEAIRGADGSIVGLRGYVLDRTADVTSRRSLERSEAVLKETQRMARLGSWEWDIASERVTWSDELFEMFGLDPSQSPLPFAEQGRYYEEDSWEIASRAVQVAVRAGEPYLLELEVVEPSSTVRWVQARGEAVRNEEGAVTGLRGFVLDITQRKDVELALAASESLFRTGMLASPIGMAMSELDGSFRVVNEALCDLLGYDESWFADRTIEDITYSDDVDRLRREQIAVIEGEASVELQPLRLVRSDGQVLWVTRVADLIPGTAGGPDYVLAQYVDTTSEQAALDELAYQASHDPLTGLRNWARVMECLEEDLRSAPLVGSRVGVLFVDLDNFKIVNDSLGHAAGDEVLMTVADRITGALRPSDQVGRAGGDEFIVVVPDVMDVHEVESVADRIVSTVGTDLMIRGHRIVPTVSIGIALSDSDSTSASMLRDADAALYRAKAAGRARWQVFDEAMHTQAVHRLTIEDEIRQGLSAAEFGVHYQPIVTLVDRRVVGHEALVRWQHPTRGLLTPSHFLSAAEDSGLIVGIEQFVLDQVCALLASTHDLPGPISVNFSPVRLAHAGWFDAFADTLDRHGVDPHRLIIEVTETAVMTLLPGTRDDLVALRNLGVGIHVDDFGTGFSSISLLRDMPVSGLKLDATFVADLSDEDDAAIALSAGLAGLVSGLHLQGVAEGVESEVQHRVLLEQGWSHAQGFLYGPPASAPSLTIETSVD